MNYAGREHYAGRQHSAVAILAQAILTHLSIMRMAYKRAQGDSPPEGGWPPEVLEYDLSLIHI